MKLATRLPLGLVVATLSACGGDSSPTDPPPPQIDLGTVTVGPYGSTLIAIGDAAQLEAIFRNAQGEVESKTFRWSSSNPSAVRVIQSGLVTAVGAGDASVKASVNFFVGDVEGSVTVSVSQVATQIQLWQSADTATVGEPGVQFHAFLTDSSSYLIPNTNAEISWSSSNLLVATVNAYGFATGIDAGSAYIVAEYSLELRDSLKLVVQIVRPLVGRFSLIAR